MDEVFRALADASRRRLLDRLNARNGQSLRELCAGLDMARQSVSKHLAVLEGGQPGDQRKSRLDLFKPAVDQMLRADLDAPRKQRHALKRIFGRLVAEYEMEGISYAIVADYVRWRHPEVRVE